eukprot:TRINITY_DN2768_c0_g1_i1.p1 TRINITY_DN2768_c0_g1~~TRINITY_DN2768_c0_g1_i1.p1  ORF type:complete len:577 (-),score=247.69 TRINITY_DN2768_c0_g1_i1:132-1799(-)
MSSKKSEKQKKKSNKPGVDYSVWNNIELSDDSDIETHPNVDTNSLKKWRMESIRIRREEERERKQQQLEEKAKLETKLKVLEVVLKTVDNEEQKAILKKEYEEVKKEHEDLVKKMEEEEENERNNPTWHIENICRVVDDRTMLNHVPTEDKKATLTPEDEEMAKQFAELNNWKEIHRFVAIHKIKLIKQPIIDRLFHLSFVYMYQGEEEKAKRHIHQALILQYCISLGSDDGLYWFFKKMRSKEETDSQKVFQKDFEERIDVIRAQVEYRKEGEGEGEREREKGRGKEGEKGTITSGSTSTSFSPPLLPSHIASLSGSSTSSYLSPSTPPLATPSSSPSTSPSISPSISPSTSPVEHQQIRRGGRKGEGKKGKQRGKKNGGGGGADEGDDEKEEREGEREKDEDKERERERREVFDSLPKGIQEALEGEDNEKLNSLLSSMPTKEANEIVKRCQKVGIIQSSLPQEELEKMVRQREVLEELPPLIRTALEERNVKMLNQQLQSLPIEEAKKIVERCREVGILGRPKNSENENQNSNENQDQNQSYSYFGGWCVVS